MISHPLSTLSEGPESEGPRLEARDGLWLLIESERPWSRPARLWLERDQGVIIGRGSQRQAYLDRSPRRLEVADPWMSREHARVKLDHGRWVVEDVGSRNGIFVNGERQERALLQPTDVLQVGRTLFSVSRVEIPLTRESASASSELDAPWLDAEAWSDAELFLRSLMPRWALELGRARRLLDQGTAVAIEGPLRSGKQSLAKALAAAAAGNGPFVVELSAPPERFDDATWLEEQVRAVGNGVLFLPEVDALPPGAQRTLGLVLTRPELRSMRIVSTVKSDLEATFATGQMDGRLAARTLQHRLAIPVFAERGPDLGLFIARALLHVRERLNLDVRMHPDAARALYTYRWPLQALELESALEMAAIVCRGEHLRLEHLPQPVREALPRPVSLMNMADRDEAEPPGRAREQREALVRLLIENDGNVTKVARAMGKARTQVQRWLKRYSLNPIQYRSSGPS